MKPSVRGIHSDNQKPERRPFGRAPRPVTRATGPALFIRVCLLLALMGAWLPASLAAAQAPDGGAPEGIAAPQAAIWSSYPIFGGNMESMASDPFNGQVFYVGTESAGVYKTTDAGATWQPARAGLPPAAKVISLAVDPQNSNTLYAGTDAVGIIWKSQDAGATWTNITHNMQYGTSVYADEAYNIVVDPHNSNVVYASLGGSDGQIYKTTDGGATWWVSDNGIPRKSGNFTKQVLALAIDPTQSSVLYAGGREFGVYKTTDGGANWTALNDGIPIYRGMYRDVTALAVDPLHDNRPAGIIDGKYYVFGAGGPWVQLSTDSMNDSYDHAHLYFHPTDPNVIYSAGNGLTKSTDGGVHWVDIDGGYGDVPAMAFHPSAVNTLLAADQVSYYSRTGGVRKSLNGGLNWIAASTGLAAQPIQGVAIDPQNPNNLYAGQSDWGYSGVWRSTDRGATWNFTATDGQLLDIVVDPLDSMKIYTAADYYFLVSDDQGATFTKVPDIGATCLAIAPGASNPVYAGDNGVYKSTDGGMIWLPKTNGFPQNSSGGPAQVMSLAVDPNNASIVWAGTEREGIVKSTNGGDTWQVKGFVDVPDVDAIAVRPGDSNTILVGTGEYRGTSGSRSGEIYKSTDGGQTWQLKYRGKGTVADIKHDPRNPNWVYASTTYVPSVSPYVGGEGVLRSLNGGETWSSYGFGLFNQVVFSLAISSEDPPLLLAGTMGSGLYGTQPPRLKPVFLPLVVR